VIAPPDASEDARAAVLERLRRDLQKAEDAALLEPAAADVTREVLAQAGRGVATPEAFAAFAAKLADVGGIDPGYRQSIVWVLRALGSPRGS